MYRFMHVGFAFPGVPKMRDLEPVFVAMGDDWIRYSATSWIMWTQKQAFEIFVNLRPYIDAHDQVLIAKLDPYESFGSLTPWIWTWINNKMPNTITTGAGPENRLAKLLTGQKD